MSPHVRFVYSNHPNYSNQIHIPAEMGTPRADQLQGTPLEQLVELAGRVCYDSLGKGRSSDEYHKHIIEVNHGSVWDHGVVIVDLKHNAPMWPERCMAICANRPGVWTKSVGHDTVRVTANLRAVREWASWKPCFRAVHGELDFTQNIEYALSTAALYVAPRVMQGLAFPLVVQPPVFPQSEDECWVSMFFTAVSRGLSHELVRHNYQTAKSQRSTRYCDESESEWILHPEMRGLLVPEMAFTEVSDVAKAAYRQVVTTVMEALIKKGTDKPTAHKQARGAARGLLGNALSTELIFSANISQWKRMLAQRCSPAADAEIREAFSEVKEILTSKFPEYFE